MPDISGADHVEFFVVPTTKAAELAALSAELASLAADRRRREAEAAQRRREGDAARRRREAAGEDDLDEDDDDLFTDDDDLTGDEVDALLLKLERLSTRSTPHEITVHPQGNPAYAHYTKQHGLLDTSVEYDPSDYLGDLYSGGIELTTFPLLLVNFFQGAALAELVTKMSVLLSQRMFPNERDQLAAAHAFLSRVDPGREVVVLWYVQWM